MMKKANGEKPYKALERDMNLDLEVRKTSKFLL